MCKDQYVGFASKKPRFGVHKVHINTGKDRYDVAKHFLTRCTNVGKLKNIEVHLIEQVEVGKYDVEGKFRWREKYWKAQLFTLLHGMNSKWDCYSHTCQLSHIMWDTYAFRSPSRGTPASKKCPAFQKSFKFSCIIPYFSFLTTSSPGFSLIYA